MEPSLEILAVTVFCILMFSDTTHTEEHLHCNHRHEPTCQLVCVFTKQASDFWQCEWQSNYICVTLTASIMNDAITTDPKYPFLRNFSSASFHVGFDAMKVTRLGDGFLSGYPQLRGFKMENNHCL